MDATKGTVQETEMPVLSENFQRWYYDAKLFEPFSTLHPVSFRRVLPFEAQNPVQDDVQFAPTLG